MNPYVMSVQPQDDYRLLITFENGETRIFDLKPYFESPVFKKLKSTALFKTAQVVSGSVEWQGEVDLSYDTLYLESKPSKESTSKRKTVSGKKKNVAVATLPRKKPSKTRVTAK